eukprot:7911187-Pyramimonas_sp.AAC.1
MAKTTAMIMMVMMMVMMMLIMDSPVVLTTSGKSSGAWRPWRSQRLLIPVVRTGDLQHHPP